MVLQILSSIQKIRSVARQRQLPCTYTLANQGSYISIVARSEGGGVMMSPKETPVTRYQYPADSKVEMAIQKTAKFIIENCDATGKWLSNFTETPFSQEQIMEMKGTQFG